jgi:hypothetical protein
MRIKKSTRADKKFMITSPEGRLIHFGQAGYKDYEIYLRIEGKQKADDMRDRYIKSHSKIKMGDGSLAWENPETAEYYSHRGLWNMPRGNALFKQVFKIRSDS